MATSTIRQRLSVLRQPVPPAAYAKLCRAAMVLLGLIVVTGAAVRLTKSGLGCPTWPQCGDGSFVTRAQFSLHGVVEFTNRIVSLGVGLVIAAVVIGAFRLKDRRRDLRLLSGGLVLGFVAQAVLGGLTVIFHLNPALVAGHFLVSMLLLWNAAVLDTRARQGSGAPVRLVRRELILLADLLAATAGAVLILGTVVTGAGPHSGDTGDVQRFEINIRSAAQLHADGAMLLTGLIIAMAFAARLVSGPPRHQEAVDGARHHRHLSGGDRLHAVFPGDPDRPRRHPRRRSNAALDPGALPAAVDDQPRPGRPALRSADRGRWRGRAASGK